MTINVENTVAQLLGALKEKAAGGFDTIAALAEDQGKKIASQAAMITQSRAMGSLRDDDNLFNFFVDQLKEMAANLARTVAQLTILTLEEAWNAIVGVIWGAINTVLKGAGLTVLPIPTAPGA